MNEFVYLNPKKVSVILNKYNTESIFLVHGKKSYVLSGAESVFSSFFNQQSCQLTEYTDFSVNPKMEDVEQGVKLFQSKPHSLIIGVGGGSTLDIAKLIRFFSAYAGNPISEIYEKKAELKPLLLFPTTAGTGSETTHFAVCYINKKKYSVSHGDIFPTASFVDYRFTVNNPPYLSACAGFDALAHAIESYWSVKSTEESRKYAKEAITILYPALLCVHKPSSAIRERVSYGAHLAGKAINISMTTAAHAYSYGITMYLGIPHGHAVSCGLPYFFEKNMGVADEICNDPRGVYFVKERMYELCSLLNIPAGKTKLKLTEYIQKLFNHIQITFPKNTIWHRILDSVNLDRLYNNPVKIIKKIHISDFCL
jgi:alcohol dehydrogenase class IV